MRDGVRIELIGTFVNPNPVNRPHKKPMKPSQAGFCRGGIAALIALYKYEGLCDVAYREVVNMFTLTDLVKIAKRDGDMRASGLSDFLRTEAAQRRLENEEVVSTVKRP